MLKPAPKLTFANLVVKPGMSGPVKPGRLSEFHKFLTTQMSPVLFLETFP